MVKAKLSSLERAAARMGASRCGRCGGRNGVGGVPLVVICGKPGYGTYAPNGQCPRCGATPPHVVEVVIVGRTASSTLATANPEQAACITLPAAD